MKLYCMDASPPNRAVFLCLEALGLKPERQNINLLKNEQRTPEFCKINPQHSIPTLDDDGFIMWDSHAINAYLVSKYGKDDSLYPKNLEKRALVDQRMHFDSGILFPRTRDIIVPLVFLKCKEIPEAGKKLVNEAFDLLEKFLEGRDFVAGDAMTIADFCCVATVATLVDALRFSVACHPRVEGWLRRCERTIPGYETAQRKGLNLLKAVVDQELGPQ